MKSKRDITLGEIQDECRARTTPKGMLCAGCMFREFCVVYDFDFPNTWDLDDKPLDSEVANGKGE